MIYTISAIQETMATELMYACVVEAGLIYLVALLVYNYVKKPREYVYDD